MRKHDAQIHLHTSTRLIFRLVYSSDILWIQWESTFHVARDILLPLDSEVVEITSDGLLPSRQPARKGYVTRTVPRNLRRAMKTGHTALTSSPEFLEYSEQQCQLIRDVGVTAEGYQTRFVSVLFPLKKHRTRILSF